MVSLEDPEGGEGGVAQRCLGCVWPTGKLGTCRPRWENAAGMKVVTWGRPGGGGSRVGRRAWAVA